MEAIKQPNIIKQEDPELTLKEQELPVTESYSEHETSPRIVKVESPGIIGNVKDEVNSDMSDYTIIKQEVQEVRIKEEQRELPVVVWNTLQQTPPVQVKVESSGTGSSAVQEGVRATLTGVQVDDAACLTPKLKQATTSNLGVAKEITAQIPDWSPAEIEVSLDFEDLSSTRQHMQYLEKSHTSKTCQKRAAVSKLVNRNLPWKRKKGSQCTFEASAASRKVLGQDNAEHIQEKEKIDASEMSVSNRRRLALSVLRDQCLQVITQWYMGHPFSEIAHNMNLNPDSVRHILHVWCTEKRLACHKPGQGKIKGKVKTGKGQVPTLWKWRFLVAAGKTSALQCMVCDKRLNSAKMDNIACHIRKWHPYSAELPQRVRRAIHKAWKRRQGLHKLQELQANFTEKHEMTSSQNEKDKLTSPSLIVQQNAPQKPDRYSHVHEIKNTVNDSRLCNRTEDHSVQPIAADEEKRELDIHRNHNIQSNKNNIQEAPKQRQMRYFQDQWRQKYLVDYDWKAEEVVCLVCGLRMRCLRSCTFARHAQRRHPESMNYSKEIRNALWNSWNKGQHSFPLHSPASGMEDFKMCSKKLESLDMTKHHDPGKMKCAATAMTPEDTVEHVPAKSNCTAEEQEVSPSTSHAQNDEEREFEDDWCKELAWLRFDQNTGIAKCEICASFPGMADQASMLVKGFSGPFKLETLKEHSTSLQHQKCVKAKHALLTPEATPLPACIEKMDEGMFTHMNVLFTVAYYIAKNNRPYTDFEGLLELTWKLGVAVREEYANDKRCKEFISHIATVIRKELICELKEARYVSLMLDRLIDKGGVEELILYVRYIKNDRLKEAFLSVLPLELATADGYLETITKDLKMHGLLDWLSSIQLVGIGTDGAASIIGDEDGLVQKVRQNLSHVIGIHSIAHKLNLSVLSSMKKGKVIDDIDSVLKKLYHFYQHSPKRMGQLKKVAESFHKKILKCQYLNNLRRVASKVSVLSALVKDWKSVSTHLESVAAEKDNASAVAKGLFKKLTDYKFVYMLHFLLDYLEIINHLSLSFQTEELFLNAVELNVKNTISSLNSLKDVPRQHEETIIGGASPQGVYQNVQLHGLNNIKTFSIQNEKHSLIQHGVKYLEDRFLNQSNIERSTAVFDTFTWPSGPALQDYGVDDITALARHFQKQLLLPEMDDQCILAIHNEWVEFKALGKGKKLSELLDLALSDPDKFPVLGNLLCIVSVLPVSTTCCERGFNLMNLVKHKFRSSMQQESLGDLLMINMNGPSVNEFDALKAVDHWYFNSKNTRHVHGHKKPSDKNDTLHKISGLQECQEDCTKNLEMERTQAVLDIRTHTVKHNDGPPIQQGSQNCLYIQEEQNAISGSRLKNQTEDNTVSYLYREPDTHFKQSYFQHIRQIHTYRKPKNTPQELKKKQTQTRNFQEYWRLKYMVDYDCKTNEAVCILCGLHMRSLRSCTFQRHARRHPEFVHYAEETRNDLWKTWNKGERIYPLRHAGGSKSGINLCQDKMERQQSLPENPKESSNTEEYMAKQQEQIEIVLKRTNSQHDGSCKSELHEQK